MPVRKTRLDRQVLARSWPVSQTIGKHLNPNIVIRYGIPYEDARGKGGGKKARVRGGRKGRKGGGGNGGSGRGGTGGWEKKGLRGRVEGGLQTALPRYAKHNFLF